MANYKYYFGSFNYLILSLPLLFQFYSGESNLQLNYYSRSCPRAEEIIKEEVTRLYLERYNTAVSWIRNIFHDCSVKSCDASLLLDTANGIETEKTSFRNFGMRNFDNFNKIKDATEKECPMTVSCADIIVLSARDAFVLLGGPHIEMKTGRRDSKKSYAAEVEKFIPNNNDTMSTVLSVFQAIGIDTQGAVALLGSHSIGRTHCVNIVNRLYPNVDPTIDHEFAKYLKKRCPSPNPDPNAVEYVRNDLVTPTVVDNWYYKHILDHKGVTIVDQELLSDPTTHPFVEKFAADNQYFLAQFSKAMLILSENNPLTGDQGEIRKDCRFVNKQ